jgi:N-methylhydantoinase A/oxoprolinase/acetone carboxylase beta subunit
MDVAENLIFFPSGASIKLKSKSAFLLGIDTGGTYTDAVVVDRQRHRIVASAKAITTKGNLAIGVAEAMSRVLALAAKSVNPADIAMISVSTTLATNAVVEGHGAPVGVVLIGFDDQMANRTGIAKAFPSLPVIRIAGGHDHNGIAIQDLDIASLKTQCVAVAGSVSAFAVASAFAVRNAVHERAARETILAMTHLPVTLSTEISSALDAPRRALTATLNARLIARISQLISSVQEAAAQLGLDCPLMIVKGDGTLASADAIAARPIETILSGPAASLIGAKWLSGLDDFIMSDMGGTTTDIGILSGGRPKIALEGANVGGWRTMVKAIDIRTIGLGGDSEVHLGSNGEITIGPERALPISLLAHRNPEMTAMLESDLAETEGGSLLGKFVVRPFGTNATAATIDLLPREKEILAFVSDRPLALRKVAAIASTQRAVQSLRRKGLLQYCTLTPSDAAHVLDLQSNWSREAAVLAAKIAVRFRTMKMPDEAQTTSFCNELWSRTVSFSAKAVVDTALGSIAFGNQLIDSVCDGNPTVGFARVSIAPTVPIVAVGGPVKVFYPEVARRLGCEVIFAPFCDVANAAGSAAGHVGHAVDATVEGDGQGQFRVHVGGTTTVYGSGVDAVAAAVMAAERAAEAAALASGAYQPRVSHTIEKHMLPDAMNDDGLLSAKIRAEAVGQPVTDD